MIYVLRARESIVDNSCDGGFLPRCFRDDVELAYTGVGCHSIFACYILCKCIGSQVCVYIYIYAFLPEYYVTWTLTLQCELKLHSS